MFIGRKYELDIIRSAIASKRAELGIVYGRRRVGKSTLLENAANVKNTKTSQIIAHTCHQAFDELTRYIGKKNRDNLIMGNHETTQPFVFFILANRLI